LEYGWQFQRLQLGYCWGVEEVKDNLMLVAYGPEGRPVVAESMSLEQLKILSQKDLLYCPNCRGIVHVRGGPEKRTQLHFAHLKGECSWSTESETVRHMRGKLVLASWLRKQFPQANISLEKRLPEPNRIADVFVNHADGRQWAFEFQCAPLDSDEWQRRHHAYHKSKVKDIWIIGSNRREKQEAFIEAIIAATSEVLFLDPLLAPPLIWLRWAVARETIQQWRIDATLTLKLEGWIGRSRAKLGATLHGQLQDVCVGMDGRLLHHKRTILEVRSSLLRTMQVAQAIDEDILNAYLNSIVGEETLNVVLFPMLRAFLRDPNLLTRYNFGRGCGDLTVSDSDKHRVQQAHNWLERLSQQGYTTNCLEKLAKQIPLVGPYAAFANFVEMLAFLSSGVTNKQS
jgi:Competence protein CoiA-like family